MIHAESRIQIACVSWFRMAHRDIAPLLNSVPNGLLTSATQARIAVAEGLTKGVADLELNVASGGYHGLKIEMKKDTTHYIGDKVVQGKTYQRKEQKEWQKAVEEQGYKYIVCRSLAEFIDGIEAYLGQK